MTGVDTITMDATEARERYDEYRAALKGKPVNDDDRGILLGYKALAKGHAVLNVFDVFRRCPLDEKKRPRLAIARADWEWCFYSRDWNRGGRAVFGNTERRVRRYVPKTSLGSYTIAFPGVLDGSHQNTLRAIVPIIPPNLRPRWNLENYLILWEAEWEPVAPVDPLLLREIQWPLCAVLAAWDLTPLERAVLTNRLSLLG